MAQTIYNDEYKAIKHDTIYNKLIESSASTIASDIYDLAKTYSLIDIQNVIDEIADDSANSSTYIYMNKHDIDSNIDGLLNKTYLKVALEKLVDSYELSNDNVDSVLNNLNELETPTAVSGVSKAIKYKNILNENGKSTAESQYVELPNGLEEAYADKATATAYQEYSAEAFEYSYGDTADLATNKEAREFNKWLQNNADESNQFDWTSWSDFFNSSFDDKIKELASNGMNGARTLLQNSVDDLNQWISGIMNDENSSLIARALTSSLSVVGSLGEATAYAFAEYNDGSTETAYGNKQQTSWRAFVDAVTRNAAKYKIRQLKTTPLDSGDNGNLFGRMIMGVPPTFTDRTDPRKRVMVNTFIKDARYLSLTPGLPKYNGSRYFLSNGTPSLDQTTTPDQMLDYLLKNGVDKSNLSKDKRYYTFAPSYGKFYSYLETMLNTVWLKLGLGTVGNNEFSLFTFFNNLESSTSDGAEPLSQYKSAIGFFVDPTGAVAENVTNGKTSFGQEFAGTVNNKSEEYQKINYITGMGTGGAVRNTARTVGLGLRYAQNIMDFVKESISSTIGTSKAWGSRHGLVGYIGGAVVGAASDLVRNSTEVDMGSQIQAFATTNGMHVMYPELWDDGGGYSRSVSFDFNFTSPYGDPLSIFKYVYVPFCALLCFTLPRAADDNGYVSPFFVRADMPGLFTCDLGIVSNLSYTRGGPNGLFTKDGLPRSISGNFTIDDLYPYLAMSRRISFLSANPSYTSFLDSLTGFNAVYNSNDSSELSNYWRGMLNRVNGEHSYALWNSFDADGRKFNFEASNAQSDNRFTISPRSINWFRKV